MERLRLALIRWNVAPILFAAFWCWLVYLLVQDYINDDQQDMATVGIIFTFATGVLAFVKQIYNGIQKDRRVK